jgi:hypothetical protein
MGAVDKARAGLPEMKEGTQTALGRGTEGKEGEGVGTGVQRCEQEADSEAHKDGYSRCSGTKHKS